MSNDFDQIALDIARKFVDGGQLKAQLQVSIVAALRQAAEDAASVAEVQVDVYDQIAEMIEPHVQREGINPKGALPASVHDSVAILLEYWVKGRQPVAQEAVSVPGTPSCCKHCGSAELQWFAHVRALNDVQQGRLNTHDVGCVFVLGCEECSETLRVVKADDIAALLNAALPEQAGGVQAGALEDEARSMFEAQADKRALPWSSQGEGTKDHWRKAAIAARQQEPQTCSHCGGDILTGCSSCGESEFYTAPPAQVGEVQGDALAAINRVVEQLEYMERGCRIHPDYLDDARVAQAALAARQPVCATVKDSFTVGGGQAVGEPVGYANIHQLNDPRNDGVVLRRKDDDGFFTEPLYRRPPAQPAQPSPGGQGDALVDTARRNIRQFISKASFSSSVDQQAALSCVDVLEEALAARQPGAQEPVEMTAEFTDTGRAAIAWVLWHHQGGSSPVGQPLRFALGMGQHDRMTDQQIAEAKRFAAWAGATTESFHRRSPAQGIDLGQVRVLLQGAAMFYDRGLKGRCRGRIDDALALIDQRDAAPGGGL